MTVSSMIAQHAQDLESRWPVPVFSLLYGATQAVATIIVLYTMYHHNLDHTQTNTEAPKPPSPP